jgi:hypothetical protein
MVRSRSFAVTATGLRKAGWTAFAALLPIGLLVAAPLAAGAVLPSERPAATPTVYVVTAAPVPVKTANGDDFQMQVSLVDEGITGEPDYLFVTLGRKVTAGGSGTELHEWQIPVTASAFSFNAGTKKGTVNTGAEADPIAVVDLSITGGAATKGTCKTGTQTYYAATLKGEVELTTGLKAGGTVGGKTLTIGSSRVSVDAGCTNPPSNPCGAGIGWESDVIEPYIGLGGTLAISGHSYDFMAVTDYNALSAPKGSIRIDEAELNGPVASYDSKTHSLTITSSTAGIVTGGGVISGGAFKSSTQACVAGKKASTEPLFTTSKATWTSTDHKPLTAHTALTGNFSAPATSTTADFDITT